MYLFKGYLEHTLLKNLTMIAEDEILKKKLFLQVIGLKRFTAKYCRMMVTSELLNLPLIPYGTINGTRMTTIRTSILYCCLAGRYLFIYAAISSPFFLGQITVNPV